MFGFNSILEVCRDPLKLTCLKKNICHSQIKSKQQY